MYAQRNFLLTDLQAALSKKVEEAKALSLGAVELRLANDGRAWLCVSALQQDGSVDVISIDL